MGIRKLTKDQELEVVRLYTEDKISANKIAVIYQVDVKTITNYLGKNNIVRRLCTPKYPIVEDYFENIDTSEKAYWLGFITADGCVHSKNTLSIQLGERDVKHLEKFRDVISPNRLISIYYPKNNYSHNPPLYKLAIHNSKIKEDLEKLNVVPRKTYITKFPNIDPKFYKDFIRGVFDGDGSICISKNSKTFSIIGNRQLMSEIQNILMKECNLNLTKLIEVHPERCIGIYNLVYRGNIQVQRIYEYLYTGAEVFLERKKYKFE